MPAIEKTLQNDKAYIPRDWRDIDGDKSDTVDLPGTCIGIAIETAAAVKVEFSGGNIRTIPAVIWTSKGLFIEGHFTRVWSTGTGVHGEIWGAFV